MKDCFLTNLQIDRDEATRRMSAHGEVVFSGELTVEDVNALMGKALRLSPALATIEPTHILEPPPRRVDRDWSAIWKVVGILAWALFWWFYARAI